MSSLLAFVERHPGLLLVLIGVVGEIICDWKDMRGRLALAKRFSAILLIFGLVIEFIEAAKSDRDVSSAIERAGIAEREAGQANERAATNELQVEILRKANSALDDKVSPRVFEFNADKFAKALIGKPKFRVEILYPKDDVEAYDLAMAMVYKLAPDGRLVSLPRPITENDISDPDDRDNPSFFSSVPLLIRMGIDGNSIEFLTKNMPDFKGRTGMYFDFQNAIVAGFEDSLYGPSGAVGRCDSRLPDDEIKLVIGTTYRGIMWINGPTRHGSP